MILTVYDSNRQQKAVLSPEDSSTQAKALQSDNVLTLSFTLYEYIPLDVNDYVDFKGERYWLTERYLPNEKNTREWKYDVKFYGIESLIKRFLVLNTVDGDPEPVFTLTAPPREHVALIVKAINDGMDHTADWKVGSVEGTDNIVIDYEGKFCNDALKEVAGAVPGAEWWIEGQTVNICRCEHGEEVTLAYGKGLTEIERDTADGAKFYTRLFPIGSSRNIDPEKYGHSRLQLPGNIKYVDVNADKYGIFHRYEKDAFADIYPRRVGTVSSVRNKQANSEDGTPFTIYYFKDDTLDFDPNNYELGGKVKRVSFQEGSELAGLGDDEDGNYYFEVNFDSDTREFEIITIWPYADDTQLPGDKLVPKAGDKYILWNTRMPDEYYALAEEEYRTAVDKYNEDNALDISVYKGPTDHVYIEQNNIGLYLGLRVRLESMEYFPETGYRSSRITRITRKVNLPSQANLEISDALSTGVMESINQNITDVKNYTRSAVGSLPDIVHTGDRTRLTDNNLLSALRVLLEISTRSVSKEHDDTASGLITFLKGLISEALSIFRKGIISEAVSIFKKGVRFGNFVTGMIGGSGGAVTVDEETGKTIMEVDKAIFREEMVVPKITFNCTDVISGDKANTFAFGTVKSIDTVNRIIELDLLEDQLGTPHVNDIIRGVFHKLEGGNKTSDSVDTNGFLNYSGFATAYFTPSEILQNEPGTMKFRYTLQPGTTVHPSVGMNFYAYGNFTDLDRQAMTYETRYYTRRLKNVNTWVIDPTKNISMQDGLLEGLTIGGFVMHGYGTFQENTYLTGVNIQFTPSQLEELQGKSAYSVSLSSYERVVKLDSQGNLTSLYEELNVISGNQNLISANENVVTSVYNLSTRIQAFKGETELLFSDAVDKDRYVVVVSATGCRASVSAGILTITEVTNYEECYVDLKINCEGNAVFDKRFSVVVVRNGTDGEGSIVADLSNWMQSVSCDASGAVTSGLPLGCTFSMYYGATQLTLDSLSRTSVPGVTSTTDKDTGIVTITAIDSSAADTIRIPITGKATHNGIQYERTVYLSINKVRPGADGKNPVIYSLQPSMNIIKKNSAGNSVIADISCRILKTDGALTVVSSRPSGYSLDYIIDSGTPQGYTPGSNIATSGITKDITFRLYAENSSGITLVDQETIPVVQDGKNGVDGTDGHSPYISEHGTWMVWDDDQGKYVDSGDSAKGDDGHSPKIENGTWWVWDADQGKYIDTGIKAKGEDGLNGKNGKYTELRYKYSNGKPDKPSGISPEGWSLDPDVKEPDLTHSGDFYLSDLYYTTGTSTVWNKTYLQRISFVAAEKGQSFKLQVNCYTSRSLRYAVVMKLDTPYTSSYNSEDTLWIGGGYQYTSIEVIAPSAGSHYIELAYAAASSSYAEGQMNYRIIPQKVCYLSSAVIDPNTDSLPVWSDPVVFPTDFPGEEQIYLLSASEMTVEMPRSDSFADDYIGDAYGYNASQMYTKGDVVKYNGVYKVLIAASASGISPDNTQYWQDTKWWTDNPSGVSEAYPYEYTCVRRFNVSNGIWGSYTNYRLFMNLAKDGQSAYQLVASVSQIGRTSTGSYEPETFTVSHKDAEGNAVDAYIGVYGSQDGGAWTKIGSITKVSTVSVNVAQYPYKYFVIRTYEASSSSFDNYLLSTSVSVLSDGEKGDTGATGAMPVYCGFFSAGTEYTYTNTTRDIVNYEIDGGVFTFQVKRHGSAITVPPTSSTGDANWEPAGKFKFVAMDTALIDGANIAGFMYKDLLMKSRLGLLRGAETDIKDVSEADMQWFKPYLQLDGNAGYIDAMANVRVAYQIIDAGTDLKKNLSWMVLNAAGYNRINNLGNPDTGLGLQIYMHELGSQVFICNFYSYTLYVYLKVQLSNDSTAGNLITTIKIKIPAYKIFRGVIIPDAYTYRSGGVTVIEQDGTGVHYPFALCILPYSELKYLGVTGTNNNIPYYEVVH